MLDAGGLKVHSLLNFLLLAGFPMSLGKHTCFEGPQAIVKLAGDGGLWCMWAVMSLVGIVAKVQSAHCSPAQKIAVRT